MKYTLLLVILCIVVCQSSAISYPQVLLCSTNQTFPTATCTFRNKQAGSFVPCGVTSTKKIIVTETTKSTDFCTIFNLNGALSGEDPYSIMTFETQALNVDHVALIDPAVSIPDSLDAYIDLIYIYRASAEITITAGTNGMYSVNQHTHYRDYPPQNIWIKLDAVVFA